MKKIGDVQKFVVICLIFFLTGFISSLQLSGQVISDPESEYSRIRKLAFSEKLTEAEAAAKILVDSFPSYGDAQDTACPYLCVAE